jgi:AraC-like DNA-binding protein
MLFDGLSASTALRVERFDDIDAFHATEIIGGARSVPLRLKEFSAARATLVLPSCQLVLLRSFARIHDSSFKTTGSFVILPMTSRVDATINGVALSDRSLIFLRGSASGRSVESSGNLHAIINFVRPMDGRGWPDVQNRLCLLKADSGALRNVSRTVLSLFRSASEYPGNLTIPGLPHTMQESLLSALDGVLTFGEPYSSKTRVLAHYTELVNRLDEILAVNPAKAYSCEALANECGVSIRTLQNAMVAIRATSIHQYLRLRRLWSVRQQLIIGGLGYTIKACALANGFWHMGEFASSYRTAFGETATQTLKRARQ